MFATENQLIQHIATKKQVTAQEATPGYRQAVIKIVQTFVDTGLASAAGLLQSLPQARQIQERIQFLKIVQEKYEHAQLLLNILEDFGKNAEIHSRAHVWGGRLDRDIELGAESFGSDERLNPLHYPTEGWIDQLVLISLIDAAIPIQAQELLQCSYKPLEDAMKVIVYAQLKHGATAMGALQPLVEEYQSAVQASVDYWFPRVLATFDRFSAEEFKTFRDYNLRFHKNEELAVNWKEYAKNLLGKLGLNINV